MNDTSTKIPLMEVYRGKLAKVNETTTKTKKPGVLNTVHGIFAQYSKNDSDLNRNNRKYTKKLWENVIASEYYKEMVGNACLFGEADHPEDRMNIHIPEVSHCITKLEIKEDGYVYGEADILDTPAGRIVNTLVEYGSLIGMSTRAEGTVRYEGTTEVVNEDEYRFHTVDFVPMPSVAKAREKRLMESLDTGYTSLNEMCKDIEKQISEMSATDLLSIKKIIDYLPNKEAINKIIEQKFQSKGEQDTFSALEETHFRLYEAENSLTESNKELEKSQSEIKSLKAKIDLLSNEVTELMAQNISEVDEEISKEAVQSVPAVVTESPVLESNKLDANQVILEGLRKSNALLKLMLESANNQLQILEKREKSYFEQLDEALNLREDYERLKEDFAKSDEHYKNEESELKNQMLNVSKANEEYKAKMANMEALISQLQATSNLLPETIKVEIPVTPTAVKSGEIITSTAIVPSMPISIPKPIPESENLKEEKNVTDEFSLESMPFPKYDKVPSLASPMTASPITNVVTPVINESAVVVKDEKANKPVEVPNTNFLLNMLNCALGRK